MSEVIVITPEKLESLISRAIKKELGSFVLPSPTLPKSKEFLNVSEAAKFLDLSSSTIYRLTSTLKIPHIKKNGKLYFREFELTEWLEKSKRKTASEIESEVISSIKKGRM